LVTGFKVCDQGIYVYSNQDESQQIVSTDCDEYYVPNWLADDGDGYGDYLQIRINGDGTIENWEELKKKLFYYANEYLDTGKIKSHVNILDYIN
jgi:predicted lipoprotein with Yx(FWY)xxD motif